jgi:hypothetical protein
MGRDKKLLSIIRESQAMDMAELYGTAGALGSAQIQQTNNG